MTQTGRKIHCVNGLEDLVVKILPTVMYRFNAIPNKIPIVFFTELEHIILKFVKKHKKPEQPKQSSERKSQLETMCSDFKLYYKATVIKTVWYQKQNRELNGTEMRAPISIHTHMAVNLQQNSQEYSVGKG